YRESPHGPRLLQLYATDPASEPPGPSKAIPHPGRQQLLVEMRQRRELGESLVLLLGTGCSLGSPWYRQVLGPAGVVDLDWFSTSVAALPAGERFTRLGLSLRDAAPSPGYLALGRLIARGWFSHILTVNIDTFLEEALTRAGVREAQVMKVSLHEPSVP